MVYPYHGQKRERDSSVLCQKDIVVTTYDTLTSDNGYWRTKFNNVAKNAGQEVSERSERALMKTRIRASERSEQQTKRSQLVYRREINTSHY